ncbi:hypothetical protein CNECB9_5430036 [Cupriavidus necator]|uniref:Uncharacterized protein n=1 Tax=Cupriavidus necator TaxID=106590 RepID=A0A1K0IQL8_CUPNE|nr:hypothetical protein CNECB9_5430036 [Cupriavidus necator]
MRSFRLSRIPPAASCASPERIKLHLVAPALHACGTGDLFFAALPCRTGNAAAYQGAGRRQTKKNAAKAAFLFVKPDPTGSKAHLDYCRLPAVVVRGVITMMPFRSVWG